MSVYMLARIVQIHRMILSGRKRCPAKAKHLIMSFLNPKSKFRNPNYAARGDECLYAVAYRSNTQNDIIWQKKGV